MDVKQFLAELQELAKQPHADVPDWPFSESVNEKLAKDPEATYRYLTERIGTRFHSREEIGAHREEFSQASGLGLADLGQVDLFFNIRTRKTIKTLEREANYEKAHQRRVKVLETACAVIAGYGSPKSLEEEYGVNFSATYNLLGAIRKEWHFKMADLRAMRSSERKALAAKVEKVMLKRYEERLQKLIKREDENPEAVH